MPKTSQEWNTGRQYSSEGQSISATLIENGEQICFEDRTRHITGFIKIRGFKLAGEKVLIATDDGLHPLKDVVMAAYDANDYSLSR